MSKTFNDVWPIFHDPDPGTEPLPEFWNDWIETPLAYELSPASNPELSQEFMNKVFYLIQSKYKYSTIVATDVDQWKQRFFSVVYEFAPSYKRKYDVQKSLRKLTDTEITQGAVQKTTHGYNPSTDISGNTDTEISTVNEQNLMKYTKGKLNGYNELLLLLKTDVTEQFINKFRDLFVKVPLKNYWSDDNE